MLMSVDSHSRRYLSPSFAKYAITKAASGSFSASGKTKLRIGARADLQGSETLDVVAIGRLVVDTSDLPRVIVSRDENWESD